MVSTMVHYESTGYLASAPAASSSAAESTAQSTAAKHYKQKQQAVAILHTCCRPLAYLDLLLMTSSKGRLTTSLGAVVTVCW